MGSLRAVFQLCLFPLYVLFSCGAEEVISNVDVHGARNLLKCGYLYLDVRTEEEFKNGHVENSLNIPYMFSTPEGTLGRVRNPKFADQVLSVCGKEDHIVVGCQTGVRSVYATIDLLDVEFKHVYNMGGGYTAWINNGFEVEKQKPFVAIETNKPSCGKLQEDWLEVLSFSLNQLPAQVTVHSSLQLNTQSLLPSFTTT